MQNKKIAVTGGIGSGKSAFCEILREKGQFVFSCDEISNELWQDESYLELLAQNFPNCTRAGKIDKGMLTEQVFSNPALRKKLNALSHPLILKKLLRKMESVPLAFAEVPLLFEGGYEAMFDEVIVIKRDLSERISSVRARSGASEKQVLARIHAQFDYETLPVGKYILVGNDGTTEDLRKKADEIFERIG